MSPRFPQTNGLVEGTVRTANKVLKKAYEDKKYPCLEILEQRNTIPGVGLSPTLLLMGRRTRSIISIKMYFPLAFEVISLGRLFPFNTCRTLHCIFCAVVGQFLGLILTAVSWISFTLRHSLYLFWSFPHPLPFYLLQFPLFP